MGEKGNVTAAAVSASRSVADQVVGEAAGIARDVAVGSATSAAGEAVKGTVQRRPEDPDETGHGLGSH